MQYSKVLVVDGDRAARDALVTCLNFVGVEAHGAGDLAAARSWLSTRMADVLVLSDDLTDGGYRQLLEGHSGWKGKTSIIVLTRALRLQPDYPVDDTLRRPLAVGRVVERVEALIRERKRNREDVLVHGALRFDTRLSQASCGTAAVAVGQIESRILTFFMGAPERAFSRLQLLRNIWPANVKVEERTVDAHIRRLRLSLEQIGCAGYIQTVRGTGYRFSAMAERF